MSPSVENQRDFDMPLAIMTYDQGFDCRSTSIGHVVLHGEMLSYQSQIHL